MYVFLALSVLGLRAQLSGHRSTALGKNWFQIIVYHAPTCDLGYFLTVPPSFAPLAGDRIGSRVEGM